MQIPSKTMVRHKKSKKLYGTDGAVTDSAWSIVVYRVDGYGVYLKDRDGTRLNVSSLEIVPNAPRCRYAHDEDQKNA